ncbi:MAG: cell division protein FtsQ [Flavobacteriaceae bacterium]|nr:MAG: cell division protein FtsQ [Flavobacteriaceae bacterium]
MKINRTYVRGFLLVLFLIVLVGFSNHKNKLRPVDRVTVIFEDGENLFMNYEMVNKLLKQNGKRVDKQPKSVVNLRGLESNVLKHPMVESAMSYLTVDNEFVTKVMQRKPVARILSSKGSFYIDRLGHKMPLSSNYTPRVLLVTGGIDTADFEDVYKLVMAIKNDTFLKQQIVGIQKKKNSEYELQLRVGKQRVQFGQVTKVKEKLSKLNVFFKKTLADKSIGKYSVINLKYNNQVVCTKK